MLRPDHKPQPKQFLKSTRRDSSRDRSFDSGNASSSQQLNLSNSNTPVVQNRYGKQEGRAKSSSKERPKDLGPPTKKSASKSQRNLIPPTARQAQRLYTAADEDSVDYQLQPQLDKQGLEIIKQSLRTSELLQMVEDEIGYAEEQQQPSEERQHENFNEEIEELLELTQQQTPQHHTRKNSLGYKTVDLTRGTRKVTHHVQARPISAALDNHEDIPLNSRGYSQVQTTGGNRATEVALQYDSSTQKLNTNPFKSTLKKNGSLCELSESGAISSRKFRDERNKNMSAESVRQVEQIAQKVSTLDELRKSQVAETIAQIERGERDISDLLKLDFLQTQPDSQKKSNASSNLFKTNITLRVLSGWGDSDTFSIGRISLFGKQNKAIMLSEQNFLAKKEWLESGLARIATAQGGWQCAYSQTYPVEICIATEEEDIECIKIQNFGTSEAECQKGVKNLEVVVNGQVRWNGTVAKASSDGVAKVTSVELSQQGRVAADVDLVEEFLRESDKKKAQIEELNKGQRANIPLIIAQKDVSLTPKSNTNLQSSARIASKPPVRPGKIAADLVINDNIIIIKTPVSALEESVYNQQQLEGTFDSLKYFNVTQEGRLAPGDRERFLQTVARDTQNSVQKSLQSVTQILASVMKERDDHRNTSISFEHDSSQTFNQSSPVLTGQEQIQNQKDTPVDNFLEELEKDCFSTAIDKQAEAKEIQQQQQQQQSAVNVTYPETISLNTSLAVQGCIPELPAGKRLLFTILTTWGDRHYVGLNAIELFDGAGRPITVTSRKRQITANPSDINTLPHYKNDPRTPDKLLDGTCLTCDDLHVWLAPFTPGKAHYITIELDSKTVVSMIRIWNFNKSRIHSHRGVRDLLIELDETPVFFGEVRKAPGNLKNVQDCFECVLFTTDESVLSKIEQNDWLNQGELKEEHDLESSQEQLLHNGGSTHGRPMTASRVLSPRAEDDQQPCMLSDSPKSKLDANGRPVTTAIKGKSLTTFKKQKKNIAAMEKIAEETASNTSHAADSFKKNFVRKGFKCKEIRITIMKAWQDSTFVGLTQIDLLDTRLRRIPVTMSNLSAKPRDVAEVQKGDPRTLDKLINGRFQTIDPADMWLTPLVSGAHQHLYFKFTENIVLHALRIYNYNSGESEEEREKGVKIIQVCADGVFLTPAGDKGGILVRKAPGLELFDYGQVLLLPFEQGWNDSQIESVKKPQQNLVREIQQEYDTVHMPRGFWLKIVLHSTWGDLDYVGLNGLEIYNHIGEGIVEKELASFTIYAEPSSINTVNRGAPNAPQDPRTVDKLVNGRNDTFDDTNMWLAPFISPAYERGEESKHFRFTRNTILIGFDTPVIISALNFWNYTKTPARGVREYEIYLDDKLLYRGYLRKAPTEVEYLSGMSPIHTTVLFNRTPTLLSKLNPLLYSEDGNYQHVYFWNEKKVKF